MSTYKKYKRKYYHYLNESFQTKIQRQLAISLMTCSTFLGIIIYMFYIHSFSFRKINHSKWYIVTGKRKRRHKKLYTRQMILTFGEEPYCTLECCRIYSPIVPVNIIRLPHIVVEWMTDTRLVKG